MPRPRVRYNQNGDALPCKVFVPAHLAKYLYREAARARTGKGGLTVDETDIVLKLIERWAEGLDQVDWPALVAELKAEAERDAKAGRPDAGSGSGKKKQPKSSE